MSKTIVEDKVAEQPIAAIAASREIERVRAEIHRKYGFWVTAEYASDLITFVGIVTQELDS